MGPNRCTVYYWYSGAGWAGEAEEYESQGQEVPDFVKYQYLERVASSFTAFILGLRADEDWSD